MRMKLNWFMKFAVIYIIWYDMMYDTIVNGKEMTIKPEHAAMIISVIETAHAQNPMSVKF